MKKELTIIVLIGIITISCIGCLDMAISGMSGSPIPIDVWTSQNNPDVGISGKYWVGSAIVSGDTELLAIMPTGTSTDTKSTTREVNVQISNINPYWIAPLEQDITNPLRYYEVDGWAYSTPALVHKPVPYMNVGPGNIVTSYKVTVSNGLQTRSAIGSSSYDKKTSPVVKIPIKDINGVERTVFVKLVNAITFPQGTLPPSSTGYSVIEGELVETDDLHGAVADWNDYALQKWAVRPVTMWYLWDYTTFDGWEDARVYIDARTPNQANALGANMFEVTDTKAKLTYGTNVFAPQVTFYIPEEIAETVTIVERSPNIVFDSIKDIEGVEGGTYTLHITGYNSGSAGIVNLNLISDAISNAKFIPKSNPYVTDGLEVDAYITFAEGISKDETFKATITAQGGLGDQTSETFNINLKDNKGQIVTQDPYIPGGTEPQDITFVLYLLIGLIVLGIFWYSGVLQTILSNPLWVLITILVVMLIVIVGYIENLIETIENMNPLK